MEARFYISLPFLYPFFSVIVDVRIGLVSLDEINQLINTTVGKALFSLC